MKPRVRRFRGFAVTDRPDGPLLWGTLRPNAEDALQIYTQWNPSVSGPPPGKLVRVDITITDADDRP